MLGGSLPGGRGPTRSVDEHVVSSLSSGRADRRWLTSARGRKAELHEEGRTMRSSPVSRRSFLQLAGATFGMGLLSACGSQQPAPPAATPAPAAAKPTEAAKLADAAKPTEAAKPAAAPTTAPAAAAKPTEAPKPAAAAPAAS